MKVVPISTDESENDRGTDDVGPAEGDDGTFNTFMKTIEPLIVTFKILGGYFEIREDTKSTNRCNSFWKRWNVWRVYATLVLVLGWVDFIRYCFAITKNDSFGPSLLLKMNFFGLLIVGAFNRTVSYVAFSNGKYRKTLLEISNLHFQKEKLRKFTIWLTVCYWCGVVGTFAVFVYHGLIYKGLAMISDYQIEPFASYFELSQNQIIFANVVSIILTNFEGAGACLPLYFSFTLSYILREEFRDINKDIEHAVNPTISTVDFEQIRQRHHNMTEIIRRADKYICFSNGSCICSMIATTILVLYSISFYTQIYNGVGTLLTYSCYVIGALSYLVVMSISAIIVNEAAHSAYDQVHSLKLDNLSVKAICQVNTFLNRLSGEKIGFTVFGIFVIDRNTILTILGLLITYFLLIEQLSPPSGSNAPLANNCTCCM